MLAGVLLGGPLLATAQISSTPQPFVEQQRQQERERALREQNERTIDQRPQAAPPAPVARIPESEAPCFRIDRVLLVGEQAELFQWAVSDLSGPEGNDSPLGRCLGTAGVNVVLARAQQAAIARGFVTTRVLAAPQDLSTGTLTLSLVPGRIAAIRLTPDSSSTLLGSGALLGSAIPARPGALLNLRDIEQGLENLKRAPTAEADIQIEPSTAPNARPGDSDLVVKYVQAKKWRVALSLDDSGTKATGRYQAGATVSVDNPFGLNDLFYLSANHSINSHFLSEPSYGTEGQTVHYSLPYGYWMLGFTASNSQYHQSVAGLNQDYVYAGKTNNAEVKLSRLLYRDQSRKTTLALKGFRRESRNFVDDTEVDVQHRVVGGWELGLNHKEFIGEATLEGTLALKHGTGGFGARTSPQEIYHRNHPDEPLEGTSRMKLYTAEVSLNAPFKLGAQKLRYSGLIRAQWNRTPLMPQDRFAIGGRYTVRGFDGETSLMGERGWLIRNDIGWAIPTGSGQSGAELYVGADYGHVGGRSTVDGLGRSLAGAVIGVRGQWSKLSYDFFMGAPIRKPEGYRTARTTFGFNLNASF
ncbi:ShlB/FhaC/HecB family hemolysin secretion/activation protein [Variovorax paradoxus]|uniref:ShlB/FhaC/HecB family hemolysin secretion/activation protein n=1 Tax=Variovorax paradoxus TaxID=34073 RepID=A0A6I6HQG2_VARPD|nr:ShlB/FhaC/HecB family hemolysin secretion/activation protein [Variovorax paradoxus]QGW85149.1 ShlB/FhaC/HecB family hemolysin secretion/activation protein [Variovorax paradoxus]